MFAWRALKPLHLATVLKVLKLRIDRNSLDMPNQPVADKERRALFDSDQRAAEDKQAAA